MVVTIVMPVSRQDFLRRIFAQLDMMPCDMSNTNLLVYVDGDAELFNNARNFVINSKFKEKLCVYRKKGTPVVSHVKTRRKRIADIHNEIRGIIGSCDYVFLLEDDTLFPLNTLERLLKSYAFNPYAGFITGVQIGRWGLMVPGIWKVDNPYSITKIESQFPRPEVAFEEIDAAGLFCCLVKRDNYVKTEFKAFEPILGPDFTFGIELRKQGLKNYVDWTINTSHLTKRGELKVHGTILHQITFSKIEDMKWNQDLREVV